MRFARNTTTLHSETELSDMEESPNDSSSATVVTQHYPHGNEIKTSITTSHHPLVCLSSTEPRQKITFWYLVPTRL